MQLREYRNRETLRPEGKYVVLSLLILAACLGGIAWSGGQALLSIVALLDVFFLVAYLYGRPKERREAARQAEEVEGLIAAGSLEVCCFHCSEALLFELDDDDWYIWALEVGRGRVLMLNDYRFGYRHLLPARTFQWVKDPVAYRHFSLEVTGIGERFLPTVVPREAITKTSMHWLITRCGTLQDTTLDDILKSMDS